jgi:hypothetical protein
MKSFLYLACAALFAGMYAVSCQSGNAETSSGHEHDMAMSSADSIKRGEYLLNIMGCNDCHTPKVMTAQGPIMDQKRMLSGHPADEALPPVPGPSAWALFAPGLTASIGPWGTSFAANLTPDETGLGLWTIDNFSKALREGKFKGMDGGRMILPPMPWQNYANLTDEDLAFLWTYLRSIPPVSNVVPAAVPPAM